MTTVVKNNRPQGGYRILVKGAPEILISHCTQVYYEGYNDLKPLSESIKSEILGHVTNYASMGLRTILTGYRDITTWNEGMEVEDLECNLILVLVFGIEDPVRPEVPAAIKVSGFGWWGCFFVILYYNKEGGWIDCCLS